MRILRKTPFMVMILSNFLWAFGESPVMIYLATYAVRLVVIFIILMLQCTTTFYIHICIFYLGFLTTDFAQSEQRQVPFLKPHLVTVTETRPTSSMW